MKNDELKIIFMAEDLDVSAILSDTWSNASYVDLELYWSGNPAPDDRHALAALLWSEQALYVRFEGQQREPLIASDKPATTSKTMALWERDVCEIFIAPDSTHPQRYFEFEVAPTGEWLDLAIDLTSGERITNWDYRSGTEAAARVEERRVLMAIKIPWEAFGCKPKAGDVWLGNLFRCVGKDPDRGYLAWRPTLTEVPNFHVPERFGRLIFDN